MRLQPCRSTYWVLELYGGTLRMRDMHDVAGGLRSTGCGAEAATHEPHDLDVGVDWRIVRVSTYLSITSTTKARCARMALMMSNDLIVRTAFEHRLGLARGVEQREYPSLEA